MLKIETFTVGPIETNCYLDYDSKTKEGLLIDPGAYENQISDFIKKENITVKFTVNTHGHYDHIGGNKKFGYPVFIHEGDAECLVNPIRCLSFLGGVSRPNMSAQRLLKEGDEIKISNISFKVIHLPGHTPGGIGLECDNVIFTGDTLFYEGVGRTDIPFANPKDLEHSLKKLMRYSDGVKVYPGHGPSSTIGHERKHNPFLQTGY
ncbi:MAG: MBL fold metallo-hydrolase [Candidatus Omnitrophica bacterium]|nr:MBL fold metallo-hydrolase [Candidatus Omnitrophota bacterium]